MAGTIVNKNNPESVDDVQNNKEQRKDASRRAAAGLSGLVGKESRGGSRAERTDRQIQEERYGVGAYERQQKAESAKKDLMLLKNVTPEKIASMRPGTLTRKNPTGAIHPPENINDSAFWDKYAPEEVNDARQRIQEKAGDDLSSMLAASNLDVEIDLRGFEGHHDGDRSGDEVVKFKGQATGTDVHGRVVTYDFEYEQRHDYFSDGLERKNIPNENARESYKIYKDGQLYKEQSFP